MIRSRRSKARDSKDFDSASWNEISQALDHLLNDKDSAAPSK